MVSAASQCLPTVAINIIVIPEVWSSLPIAIDVIIISSYVSQISHTNYIVYETKTSVVNGSAVYCLL